MRVWMSPDGVWRLTQRDGGAWPWLLERHGGLIARGRSQAEVLNALGDWLVTNGEEMPDLVER